MSFPEINLTGDSGDLPRFITGEGKRLPGVRRVVKVANPAAGTDWSVAVPSGVMWRLATGVATFTASAAVANRFPGLSFVTSDGMIFRSPDGNAIAANVVSNRTYVCNGINAQTINNGQWSEVAVPDVWIPSGTLVSSNTTAMDVADQWSNINLYVEELYATDQLLSEWHEREMEAIRAAQ